MNIYIYIYIYIYILERNGELTPPPLPRGGGVLRVSPQFLVCPTFSCRKNTPKRWWCMTSLFPNDQGQSFLKISKHVTL